MSLPTNKSSYVRPMWLIINNVTSALLNSTNLPPVLVHNESESLYVPPGIKSKKQWPALSGEQFSVDDKVHIVIYV